MSESNGLRHVVRSATAWLAALRVVSRALSLVGFLLVARWVGPSQAGVFAAGMLVISSLETLSSPALEAALVQRRQFSSETADLVWTIRVAKGLVVAASLSIVSPWIASLLNEPDSARILRLLAAVPLLSGFRNSFVVLLQRELDFRKEAWIQMIPALLAFVTSVWWAAISPTAMAFVAGTLVNHAARTAASFIVMESRPRFTLDIGRGAELFSFSRWMWASGVLVFLITHGDDLVVGALLGATALGLYQVAYRLATEATVEFSKVVNALSFPLLSRLQGDLDRFRAVFLSGFAVTASIILPAVIFVGFLASPLVAVLLGPVWSDAVPVVQILALWGAIRALGAVSSPALQAMGQPEVITKYQFIMLVLIGLLIYPFIQAWGVIGASLAVTLPTAVVHPFRYPLIARALGTATAELLRPLITPCTAGAAMCLVLTASLFATRQIGVSPLAQLAVGAAFGGGAYVATLWGVDRARGGDLMNIGRLLLGHA